MKDVGIMKKSVKRKSNDWTKFDAMTNEDVRKAALADPDAQRLTKRQLGEDASAFACQTGALEAGHAIQHVSLLV